MQNVHLTLINLLTLNPVLCASTRALFSYRVDLASLTPKGEPRGSGSGGGSLGGAAGRSWAAWQGSAEPGHAAGWSQGGRALRARSRPGCSPRLPGAPWLGWSQAAGTSSVGA
jgi:hypothetical protein